MSERLIQITVSKATLELIKNALEDSLIFCDNHSEENIKAMQILRQQITETILAVEIENKMEELLSEVDEDDCKECPSKDVCYPKIPMTPDPTKVILN